MDCPSIATTSPHNHSLLRASNHNSTTNEISKLGHRFTNDRPTSAARNDHFDNSREKINRTGRRQGYKNKTRSTKEIKSARPNR